MDIEVFSVATVVDFDILNAIYLHNEHSMIFIEIKPKKYYLPLVLGQGHLDLDLIISVFN